MIDLRDFEQKLLEHLESMTQEDFDLLLNPPKKEFVCETCKRDGKTCCGKCHCGKDGHLMSILFFTSIFCEECAKKETEEANSRIGYCSPLFVEE